MFLLLLLLAAADHAVLLQRKLARDAEGMPQSNRPVKLYHSSQIKLYFRSQIIPSQSNSNPTISLPMTFSANEIKRKNAGKKAPTAAEKKASDAEAKQAIDDMNASAKNLQAGLETHFMPGAPDEPLPQQSVEGVPVFRGNDLDTMTGTFLSGNSSSLLKTQSIFHITHYHYLRSTHFCVTTDHTRLSLAQLRNGFNNNKWRHKPLMMMDLLLIITTNHHHQRMKWVSKSTLHCLSYCILLL